MEDSLYSGSDSAFNAAYDPRYIFYFNISPILSPILLCIGPAALLATLATIAQGRNSDLAQCTGRLNARCGFVGNPDFYGLGIRLGVYLQWLASLIAYASLPRERRGLAYGYALFSLALAIALLILAFQKDCTFEAEVIVILFIFFGGVFNVLAPLAGIPDMFGSALYGLKYRKDLSQKRFPAPMASNQDAPTQSENCRYRTGYGLTALLNSLMHPMMLFSSWFWVNMGNPEPGPFTAAPCGTSFFLFAHITPKHIRPASVLMAFCSIWLSVTPYISMLRSLLVSRNHPKLAGAAAYLYASFWSNLFIGHAYGLFTSCTARLSEGKRTRQDDADLRGRQTPGDDASGHDGRDPEKDGSVMVEIAAPQGAAQSDEGVGYYLDHERENSPAADPVVIFITMVIFIWSVLGVELALVWNAVTGIYYINSTGQLIPFVAGLGALLFVYLKHPVRGRITIFTWAAQPTQCRVGPDEKTQREQFGNHGANHPGLGFNKETADECRRLDKLAKAKSF